METQIQYVSLYWWHFYKMDREAGHENQTLKRPVESWCLSQAACERTMTATFSVLLLRWGRKLKRWQMPSEQK
jgi:hypothetical protein